MNRTASTRAFALNPCPADPLGRQMVYMHMSSHYRRMYSAQSVVDSAAPSKRRAPRAAPHALHGQAAPHGPAVGGLSLPQNYASLGPTLKQGVSGRHNARHFPFSSQQPKKSSRSRPMAGLPEHPGVLSINLPVVGSQRPFLSVGSASAPCPVSRGSSSPRSSQISPRNTRANTSDTGRSVRSRQSMRGDGAANVKQAPRLKLRDRPGTYLAKLDQLAKGSTNFGPITREEENAPFKPRILSSNVQSKLKNSPVYHPPRPRIPNKLKLEERGKEGKHQTETPRSKLQSSPPGSSRDSAYNGGLSSGGESHLKARELELIKQKRQGWTSGHGQHKSGANDNLRPTGNPEGSNGDGGRVASPAYSCFSSIVSSRGGTSDVGTNVDNRDHSFNEDIESQIEEDVPRGDTSTFGDDSHYEDVSPDEEGHVEVASQTEASCNTFEEDEDSRSQIDVMAEFSPRSTVDRTVQVEEYQGVKYPLASSANATTSTGSLQRVTSACTSTALVDDVEPRTARSVGTTVHKSDEDFISEKSRWPDTAYVRLVHAITRDAVKRGVLTNKALRAIFQEHVAANKDTLDMDRMLEEWDKFRINLDIPQEEHELTDNYGLGTVKWNRADYLNPLLSEPSDIWDETIGVTPRTTLFLPHSQPTTDVATNTSRPLPTSHADFIKKIESDLREVFDPIGIMGSLGLPSENRPNTYPVSPYTITNPVQTHVEKASSPFSEPVYRQPSKDLECVCGHTVCKCTSNEKLQGYMDKWLRSSQEQVEGAFRRHSFPDNSRKTPEKGFRTPPVEGCADGTQPVESRRGTPSPKPVLPHPESTSTSTQEKKTVRIATDSNKKIREKMVVCLFDQQRAFSSNDSVNEGIFGRYESSMREVKSSDNDTLSLTIPEEVLRAKEMTQLPSDSLQCTDFDLSLVSSTFRPSPNLVEIDKEQPFKLLEQDAVARWLQANPNAPATDLE